MTKAYKKETVLEAVVKSAGVMEYVAQKLGCSWDTAKKYVNKWEETKEAFSIAECKLHTIAYQSFHKAIKGGERWAVERILDTSARRNGHGMVDHKVVDHKSTDGSLSIAPHEFIGSDADQ